ncbi:MAG: hypothetical protein C4334_12230 [Pyrinomonas sp.]|uniref:hypothetical protein n=1 Tax=Pyrinomonas sp. TaxID=2080306 RepID=UPI0033229EAD
MATTDAEHVFCLHCLARNPLGDEFCAKCGMRLMIVSRPAALRFEEEEFASHDEFILARLSALENRVERLTKEVERLRATLASLVTGSA